jgi:hypothetical protein
VSETRITYRPDDLNAGWHRAYKGEEPTNSFELYGEVSGTLSLREKLIHPDHKNTRGGWLEVTLNHEDPSRDIVRAITEDEARQIVGF